MNDLEELASKVSVVAPGLREIQQLVLQVYGKYDREKAFLWLVEEVGELVAAVRKGKSNEDIQAEMADVLAWALCLLNILGLDGQVVFKEAVLKEGSRQIKKYGNLKYWIVAPDEPSDRDSLR